MTSRFLTFMMLAWLFVSMELQAKDIVVVDSVSHIPLPNASVFNRHGDAIGISDHNGVLQGLSKNSYPITVCYLGFNDKTVAWGSRDTVFLSEDVAELPQIVVESRRHRILHVLAYVREYSTMATFTDTVSLFREKMVDYMLPSDDKVRFKGWTVPRILTSKSYYRFTDHDGLDSVSDKSQHHFSWSDWIGLPPEVSMSLKMKNAGISADTLCGKYGPAEIWHRDNERITADIDVLADTLNRKWVHNLAGFFRQKLDYEKFKVSYSYKNIEGANVSVIDLDGYSFTIESNGRGYDMFRFNKVDEPVFVSTQAYVYLLDKEYITLKEARKWDNRRFDIDEIGIYEPFDAPPLSSATLAIIDRVNRLDRDRIRLEFTPDKRLMGNNNGRRNFRIWNRALNLLKMASGITLYKSHKNASDNWNKFREKLNKEIRSK